VDNFVVAGKTGTAQMVNPATGGYYQSRLVASFVGFLPADDPRLVILVVLYDVAHGHFGGLVAAPVFSEIASGALRRLDIVPAHPPAYETASMLPFGDSPADQAADDADAEAGADTPGEYVRVALPGPSTRGGAPDFRGLSLRDAFALARANGLGLEVTGSGYVASQKPPPGALLDRGAVRIALSADGTTHSAHGRAVVRDSSKERRGGHPALKAARARSIR
jgi:cell division protein FtsI (penicillin-binding protein 3)